MCLLLNYPLANLHVATERAVDECGKMINHHFSQSTGGCQENKKKTNNENIKTYPFSLLSMWGTRNWKVSITPKMCLT